MPRILFLMVFLFLFGLISCQKKSADPASDLGGQGSPEELQPDKNNQLDSGPLKLRGKSVGLEQPHLYEVHLFWELPNREPSTFFIVKRNDWNAGRVVQGDQGFYQDNEVEEGKSYQYFVQMINGSKSAASGWIQMKVPRDKVFDGGEHVQAGELVEYERLFFKNRARITWQGQKLELRAQEIISEDAVFESFSSDQETAAVGLAGKDGGQLKLRVRKLSGSLFIRADGQNGGTGFQGEQGAVGQKGTVGPVAYLHWGYTDKEPPKDVYRYGGYWFYCNPARQPGTEGGVGGLGAVGLPGGKGGNTSKVFVEIEDTSSGDVFFTNKPGVGGEGGPGGIGGEGGEGGWSGEIDWKSNAPSMPQGGDLSLFHQCSSKQGAKGPQGPQGAQGPKGEDGFQAPFCLKRGNSQMGSCP